MSAPAPALPRTILVVEDEATIAEAVAARLRSEGFAVEIAADGPAGVECCRLLQPDLVVLDLMLPGLDGLEVCREIQRDRPVPVLMLTARDSETDLVVGLGVGADDYMTKPFSSRELVARVHALLRRVERRPAATSGSVHLGRGRDRPRVAARAARRRRSSTSRPPSSTCSRTWPDAAAGVHREELLAEVWGYHDGAGARTVDSHVRACAASSATTSSAPCTASGTPPVAPTRKACRRDAAMTVANGSPTRSTTSRRSSSSSAS